MLLSIKLIFVQVTLKLGKFRLRQLQVASKNYLASEFQISKMPGFPQILRQSTYTHTYIHTQHFVRHRCNSTAESGHRTCVIFDTDSCFGAFPAETPITAKLLFFYKRKTTYKRRHHGKERNKFSSK